MQEQNIYIQALLAEQGGDWAKAHDLIQHMVTAEASWVKGFLYRVRGDDANAEYWYHRAVQPVCSTSLATEWESLYEELRHIGRK